MMAFTKREEKVLAEIEEWSKSFSKDGVTELEQAYHHWTEKALEKIPMHIRSEFFLKVDSWLFHLHSILQGAESQEIAKKTILSHARTFQQDIEILSDLRHLSIDQLTYIADNQIRKHKIYSLAQGGFTGTGGLLQIVSDIPVLTMINVRIVQLIATTYGFEVNTPFEMMLALKVFHAATLPKKYKAEAWQALLSEIENLEENPIFYEGDEELTNESWLELPFKQLLKALIIFFFRNKTIQGLPIIGMVIGARINYQLTHEITEFAHNFYQLRYLKDKEALS